MDRTHPRTRGRVSREKCGFKVQGVPGSSPGVRPVRLRSRENALAARRVDRPNLRGRFVRSSFRTTAYNPPRVALTVAHNRLRKAAYGRSRRVDQSDLGAGGRRFDPGRPDHTSRTLPLRTCGCWRTGSRLGQRASTARLVLHSAFAPARARLLPSGRLRAPRPRRAPRSSERQAISAGRLSWVAGFLECGVLEGGQESARKRTDSSPGVWHRPFRPYRLPRSNR